MHNSSGILQTNAKTGAGVDLVQSYLDSLLRDVVDDPGLDESLLHTPAQVTDISVPVYEAPVSESALIIPAVSVEQQSTVLAAEDSQSAEAPTILPSELDPKTERIRPEWARQNFAGLLFEVAGLKMAAPLHALGGISLIEDRLQPVVGQADWFMGLLRWNGRNLRVIDTARFVMPERLESNAHHAAYQSVIVLGDSHWALAVDCADESVNLKAEEIRWKQLTGSRPWLAGTLLHRLCALLDIDNLMIMLQQNEQHVRQSLGPDNTN